MYPFSSAIYSHPDFMVLITLLFFILLLLYCAFLNNTVPLCISLDFIWIYVCTCYITSVMSDSCNPMDCCPRGFSVHGILQAIILEWVAISFSRGSSQSRDRTWVYVSCIGLQVLYHLCYLGSPIYEYNHQYMLYDVWFLWFNVVSLT